MLNMGYINCAELDIQEEVLSAVKGEPLNDISIGSIPGYKYLSHNRTACGHILHLSW